MNRNAECKDFKMDREGEHCYWVGKGCMRWLSTMHIMVENLKRQGTTRKTRAAHRVEVSPESGQRFGVLPKRLTWVMAARGSEHGRIVWIEG